MKKTFIYLLFILAISACQQRKTPDYFLLHPEKILPLYDKCVYLDDKVNESQARDCIAVLEAIPTFRSKLDQYINKPNQYALEIMQAQIRLADLTKEYELVKKAGDRKQVGQLKRKIAEEKLDIESRFALIRLVTENK